MLVCVVVGLMCFGVYSFRSVEMFGFRELVVVFVDSSVVKTLNTDLNRWSCLSMHSDRRPVLLE